MLYNKIFVEALLLVVEGQTLTVGLGRLVAHPYDLGQCLKVLSLQESLF